VGISEDSRRGEREMSSSEIHTLKATIWIGKSGCTTGIIEEIKSQLKIREIVKIRWLKNIEIYPEEIAAQTEADLIQVLGRTMILAKRS
jgi:RNA-binding protein